MTSTAVCCSSLWPTDRQEHHCAHKLALVSRSSRGRAHSQHPLCMASENGFPSMSAAVLSGCVRSPGGAAAPSALNHPPRSAPRDPPLQGGWSVAIAHQNGATCLPTWHERGATVAAAPPRTFATAADERAVPVPAPRLCSGRAAEPLPGHGAQQSIALMFRTVWDEIVADE